METITQTWRWLKGQPAGAYIVAAALILAIVTVFVATRQPPNTLAAGILQSVTFLVGIYGSYAFGKSTAGVVDPSLVHAASRNLGVIAVKAGEARLLAEGAVDVETRAAPKTTVGMISVHLSYIEDIALNEIQTWRTVGGLPKEDVDVNERTAGEESHV